MNIDSTKTQTTVIEKQPQPQTQQQNDSSVKFADELKELKKAEKEEKTKADKNARQEEVTQQTKETEKEENTKTMLMSEDKISEKNKSETAISELNSVLKELSQSDDKTPDLFKNPLINTDKTNEKDEGEILINNDFNIQDPKDKLPQMSSNMNFSGDGQPFSSFMNNDTVQQKDKGLSLNAKDLEEEAKILSTMAENTAIANKMNIETEKSETPKEKTVQRNDGIKKVDTKTGITKETVVKYDTVVMNEADVEVFANLVEHGEVNMNNLAPEAAQKSVHVSKTLADLLAKSMEDNKPVRIEFDNGISVIIKISRDGKLSADFLPSTQVAEAYLKENLPLLKQRFDEQNIDYEELNQRERRDQNKEEHERKKGRENE